MALHLTTERLVLRPLDAGDVDALHALHTDDEVMRYLSRERTGREEVRREVLPRMLSWERSDPAWGYSAVSPAPTTPASGPASTSAGRRARRRAPTRSRPGSSRTWADRSRERHLRPTPLGESAVRSTGRSFSRR